MNNLKLSPGNIVILVAGAVILVASFLPFYDVPTIGDIDVDFETGEVEVSGGGDSVNAWNPDWGFPVTTLPAVLGAAMAVVVGLTAFANVRLPERVMGFSWNQIHLLAGAQTAIMMLAFLIADSPDKGIGFWLMLLASIGLVVGAVLREREPAAA
ncbi:MAG: hypothetical protein KatS3mg009_0099 [Acidimicrobiia bacterium]|nr:MAG: hypothetical protein KatS3mg009_0099 [Acidimicrobiia bacterium]